MARFAVRRLEDVPEIASERDEPQWFPLQHAFGFTAFGANVYVAKKEGTELLARHDEAKSAQEELYLVTAGEATFTIDGERFDVPAVGVVAVPDPSVVREASAKRKGTTIVAIGGERQAAFRSSWQPKWFEDVPRV